MITAIIGAVMISFDKKGNVLNTVEYDLHHLEEPALVESLAVVEVIVAAVIVVKVFETVPVVVVVVVSFSFEILVVFP